MNTEYSLRGKIAKYILIEKWKNWKIRKNEEIFQYFRYTGFEYLLNPKTNELHSTKSDFIDSHNLHLADLEEFIGLVNLGKIEIHKFTDGTPIPIYNLDSSSLLGTYILNKCKICFPD